MAIELNSVNASGQLTEININGVGTGDKLLTSSEIDAKINTEISSYQGAATASKTFAAAQTVKMSISSITISNNDATDLDVKVKQAGVYLIGSSFVYITIPAESVVNISYFTNPQEVSATVAQDIAVEIDGTGKDVNFEFNFKKVIS